MRGEEGEFLTIEVALKLKKCIRSFESWKFKVSHSLMVGCLGEEEESKMRLFVFWFRFTEGL